MPKTVWFCHFCTLAGTKVNDFATFGWLRLFAASAGVMVGCRERNRLTGSGLRCRRMPARLAKSLLMGSGAALRMSLKTILLIVLSIFTQYNE